MALIVYTATNKANGKVYVGITKQPLSVRIVQHKSRASRGNRAFPNAIAKYGIDGFDWAIVQTCETVDELHAAEIQWIDHLNSFADTGHGYNRTRGGGGVAGFGFSDEARMKMSVSRRVRNFGCGLGRNRQKILFNLKTGTKHRQESIEQIRQSMMGRRNAAKLSDSECAAILARHQQGESCSQIAKDYSVSRPTISRTLARFRGGA